MDTAQVEDRINRSKAKKTPVSVMIKTKRKESKTEKGLTIKKNLRR